MMALIPILVIFALGAIALLWEAGQGMKRHDDNTDPFA